MFTPRSITVLVRIYMARVMEAGLPLKKMRSKTNLSLRIVTLAINHPALYSNFFLFLRFDTKLG